MNAKKLVKKHDKVELQLSPAELRLILEEPLQIRDRLADPIRATPAGSPVMLTLDDLEDLGGCVAAGAHHATDRSLRQQLGSIFARIQVVLETHGDAEPPRSLKTERTQRNKTLAEQTVQLMDWAAKILVGAEQLGIKRSPVARLPLSEAERAVLMTTPTIDRTIQSKLAAKNPNPTVGEVGGLLMAVAEAILGAPPMRGFALITTARSLMTCLEAEITGASRTVESRGTSRLI